MNVLFEAPDSFADARLGGMGKKTGCLHTKQHSGSATKLEYHDTIRFSCWLIINNKKKMHVTFATDTAVKDHDCRNWYSDS